MTETEAGQDYVPDLQIQDLDTLRFEALLPERKQLAMAAMEAIERRARAQRRRIREEKLAPVSDSVSIRNPRRARIDFSG